MKSGSTNEQSPSSDPWDAWIRAHGPALLLFARQQCQTEEDARDVLQEAVVEAWAREGNERVPPLPLVFTTIRRRAIDLARKDLRRRFREEEASVLERQDWFDTEVEDRERHRILQQAMSGLLETQRQVLTLKLWGGLTFLEIAEVLEIPANTAASRYRYALETLREALKGELT